MKSLTVWHGHSTQPSLPVGIARKGNGSLPRGRRNRLILQEKKNRKLPLGNSLLYISLLSVAFGRVRPQGAPCFLFLTNKMEQIGQYDHSSNYSKMEHGQSISGL